MATLTPTLALSAAADQVSTDALSFSVTDELTVAEPIINLARKSIATGSAQSVLASNSAFSHVYLKCVSSTNAAAFVQIKLGGSAVIKLRVGEFAFFPLYSGLTVEAEAYTAAAVLEYAQYSNG